MRRLLTVAILGILVELIGVRPSVSAVPNPATSFVSPCFVSCPQGDIAFTVIVRDAANAPEPGASVILDFGDCPGTTFCAAQEPGTTIDPSLRHVGRIADASGTAIFHARVGGLCSGAQMRVIADGVVLALRNVASMDQDGNLVVDAADQALVAGKVGGTDPSANFDCSGMVDAADQTAFASHLGHLCDATTPVLPRTWGRLKVTYR